MPNRKKQLMDSKLGSAIKIGVYTTRLSNYIPYFETHIQRLGELNSHQSNQISKLETQVVDLSEQVKHLTTLQYNLDKKISDIKHKSLLSDNAKGASSAHKTVNNTMADDHGHDKFYEDFEDRFRGSEDLIKQRLHVYYPYLTRLPKPLKKLPILDIGCGRGEFLEVVTEAGFKAIGVDMNINMVKRAKSLGYEAHENDALSYLLKQKTNSFASISGFHLVEHIPFPILLQIFEECYRVVHTDGFVLFETPNPNNLTVGASNFYMDPSHIKPIPPKLLAFALETQGFTTQIIELHPAHAEINHEDEVIRDIMRMVYGPVDYAVLASKKLFKLIPN